MLWSDSDAFAVFYDRYEAAIVGYLARRVRDPELVADLTAEVFAAALQAAPRYRASESTAAGWLCTIAHNTLAKSVRSRRVQDNARTRLGIRDAVSFQDDELEHGQTAGGLAPVARRSLADSRGGANLASDAIVILGADRARLGRVDVYR